MRIDDSGLIGFLVTLGSTVAATDLAIRNTARDGLGLFGRAVSVELGARFKSSVPPSTKIERTRRLRSRRSRNRSTARVARRR